MTTHTISQLGTQAIAGSQPAGQDVREEPAFDRLEAEVAKMASPVHSATLDWAMVTDLSAGLLAEKGKDVLVACYLAGGLLETRGLTGLADGLQVLADLLETYWEDCFPPLKRIRGRRNAVQWLMDRIQQRAAEADWGSMAPQEEALVTRLADNLATIDRVLSDKDPEAPSMRTLTALVRGLPVIEPEPEPAEKDASVVSAAGEAGATGSDAMPALDSADGAERALEATCNRLGTIGEWLLNADSSDAMAYRLDRIAVWAPLTELPPASSGQTRLPAPISQLVDALARLKGTQSDAELAQFAEAQLSAFPFWLDLNCICAGALSRMGEGFEAARREVCNETANLLARLPGLEKLSFAGGMPFADSDTQAWLGSLASAGTADSAPGVTAGARRDAVTAAIGNARALAATDDLAGATACLQEQLARQPGPADQLLLQTRLCELLLEHRPGAALKAFAQGLVDTVDRHALAEWDPAMALDALQVAYGVMARREEDQALAEALLKRIVGLNAGAAVRLVT